MSKKVTVGQIRNFLETGIGINSMVWKRIQLRILHKLNAKGFFMHEMTDDKELDAELVSLISQTLDEICSERLPEKFFK
ncbi:MAG: hypothetical protein ACOYXT_00500 [Bacteroidota bacterium]